MDATLEAGRSRLVEGFERDYLTRLLQRTSGNIAKTADIAGVNPRTLYNKMKAYGLSKEDFR